MEPTSFRLFTLRTRLAYDHYAYDGVYKDQKYVDRGNGGCFAGSWPC